MGLWGDIGNANSTWMTMGSNHLFEALDSGGEGSGFSQDLINRRQSQIDQLAQDLAKSRSQFANSLNSMYSDAFSRFAPLAEAKYASRGLQVTGGGFQSELARKAAEYQSQMAPEVAGMERSDALAVDNARTGVFNKNFDADMQDRLSKLQSRQAMMGAVGNFAGNAAMTVLGSQMNAPTTKPGGLGQVDTSLNTWGMTPERGYGDKMFNWRG